MRASSLAAKGTATARPLGRSQLRVITCNEKTRERRADPAGEMVVAGPRCAQSCRTRLDKARRGGGPNSPRTRSPAWGVFAAVAAESDSRQLRRVLGCSREQAAAQRWH